MNFKPTVNIKNIYKKALDESSFTIKMSSTITVALLIIYVIFALILNQIGSLSMLGMFDYLIAIIGICLVLSIFSPFIYSFFAINGALHSPARDKVKYTSFLKTYLIGTRPPFRGQLRVWSTLIKALAIEIILSFIVYLIVFGISNVPNTELNTLVMEVKSILSQNTTNTQEILNELNSFLLQNEDAINRYAMITGFFPLLLASYYFFHTISRNTFKYYLATVLGVKAPQQATELIFIQTLRQNRKQYYGNYYYVCFPLTILYVLVFTLSYFLFGFFGPKEMSGSILGLTSIVASVILCLPFLPVIFNFHEALWGRFSVYFMTTFLKSAQNELKIYKENAALTSRIGEENLKKAENSIQNIRQSVIDELKNKGYQDSDFEGLSDEDIFQNIAEDDSYIPYQRKCKRMQEMKEKEFSNDENSNEEKHDETKGETK